MTRKKLGDWIVWSVAVALSYIEYHHTKIQYSENGEFIYIYKLIYVYIYVCIHKYMYVYTHIFLYKYIFIYTLISVPVFLEHFSCYYVFHWVQGYKSWNRDIYKSAITIWDFLVNSVLQLEMWIWVSSSHLSECPYIYL